MQVNAVKIANAECTAVIAMIGGYPWTVPTEMKNGQLHIKSDGEIASAVLEWISAGNVPQGYVAPAPTADDVRGEAKRRMIALLGARDAAHLDMLISNGTREAVRLLRKGAANWTADDAERAAVLEAIDLAVENIRARSNALEPTPPADYRNDAHWV